MPPQVLSNWSNPSHSQCCAVDDHGFRQAGVHHFALCMHGLRTAGWGAFQQLYGTRCAAATRVGMSPVCRKLGLGVVDAGTRLAASATGLMQHCDKSPAAPAHSQAHLCRVTPVLQTVYVCKNLDNVGYPNKTWHIPVLMTYLNISQDIPKSNKADGISQDNSTCDLSRDIPRQVRVYRLIPAVCFSTRSGLVTSSLGILQVTCRVIPGYLLQNWDMHVQNEDIPTKLGISKLTFPDIFWDIPKLNKNRWDITG